MFSDLAATWLLVCAAVLLQLGNGASVGQHDGNVLLQVHPNGEVKHIKKLPQKLVRLHHDEQADGRWLFGSLTCHRDALAVDQMLPHQLQQSAKRPFDHRVLYISSCEDEDPNNPKTLLQRDEHAAMLKRVQSMQLVDEMVHLDKLNPMDLARRSMEEKAAKAFVALPIAPDYNTAMVAFLAKCLDGYDHCAWLDGDIFVHRGSTPWVDEAVQRYMADPHIIIGKPSFVPWEKDYLIDGAAGFSSRYFIYHREGLRRLLPLQGIPDDTFEAFVENNFKKVKQWKHSFFQSGHKSGSWVIHPPDEKKDLQHILDACLHGGRGLNALIAIVQQGSAGKDDASTWRDDENMDVPMWTSHMRDQCSGQAFVSSLLERLAST